MRRNNQRRTFRRTPNYGKRGGGFFRARKAPDYNPMMFVKKGYDELPEEEFVPVNKFSDFKIHQMLLQNIISKGYKTPTPIQDTTIPALLEGRDVVGVANTGTGKTAAFLVPLINKVFNDKNEKVLIVAPTRELASQIEEEFRSFSKHMNIFSVLCIGGVSIGGQMRGLSQGYNFVIGTPGRLKDLEKQRKLNFNHFRTVVLDEVDRMLDMGFIYDVRYIISNLPRVRHSLFFSATLPDTAARIMQEFLTDPVIVSVKSQPTAANIDQDIVKLNGRDKVEVLDELLLNREFEKVLVFGRTKYGMEKLARTLTEKGVSVVAIHGNKTQNQRQHAIELFKSSRVQVLVETDIASRGLDIDNVTHVINYDLPQSYEDYIHRIGRTGRANKKGFALTFVD